MRDANEGGRKLPDLSCFFDEGARQAVVVEDIQPAMEQDDYLRYV